MKESINQILHQILHQISNKILNILYRFRLLDKTGETDQNLPEIDGQTRLSVLKSLVVIFRLMNKKSDEIKEFVNKRRSITGEDIALFITEKTELKAKRKKVKLSKLEKIKTPFIAEVKEGFCVVAKTEQNKVVFEHPSKNIVQRYSKQQFEEIYNGYIIAVSEKFSAEKERTDFGILWFLQAFWESKLVSSEILLCAFVLQIFILITPLFTLIIIDKVFNSGGRSTLDVLVMGVMAMAIFDYIIGTSRRRLLQFASNKVDIELVRSLFAHLLKLPMTFFSQKQTGDTVSRLKEVETIRNFITGNAIAVLIDFPFTFVLIIVMYFFSPKLTFIVIASILISLFIYALAGPILKKRLKEKQTQTADSQSFLYEVITGIETVKSLSAESKIHSDMGKDLKTQTLNSMKTENLSGHVSLLAGFINKITVAACLWIGAIQVLDMEMTAGQLIAFNMLVGRVLGPSQRIAMMLQQLQNIRVSIKRIKEIFDVLPEPAIGKTDAKAYKLKGEIKFENVFFAYLPDSPNVLENINLSVPQGQIVGVIGISGSGKSTLMKLIQRLYIPTKGKILIDGINVAGMDPIMLRKNIGVVLQDNILLNRTIKENIAISGAPKEKIEQAAALAGADSFINELPKLYDTVVGERGQILSAGQRQRIAIARALVNDPKILILDEATSSLDYISEHNIQKNMANICRGRTVFIVAHRFSTIRIAQRIITVHKGKIVEDGSILSLLEKDGPFARLYAMQNINFKENTETTTSNSSVKAVDEQICSSVF